MSMAAEPSRRATVWPFALAGFVLGAPLMLVSPVTALAVLVLTAASSLAFRIRRHGQGKAGSRLTAVTVGLAATTIIYWLVALTQMHR